MNFLPCNPQSEAQAEMPGVKDNTPNTQCKRPGVKDNTPKSNRGQSGVKTPTVKERLNAIHKMAKKASSPLNKRMGGLSQERKW